jgi:Flp pilus assembly protein TadG
MRGIRNRISREDGVAAVEFAIILPVLALILFGVLEFGRVWSQYQLYQGAAREGARCAAVKADTDQDCDIQTEIDQSAAPFETSEDATVQFVGGGSAPNGCTPETVGQDVQVSWDQELEVNIPFWKNVTFSPTIKAVFRCEG